jgi:hypothetical protein
MKQINLNDLQKAKIRLAYCARKDIDQLNRKPYSRYLKYVCDSTCEEMRSFFDQVGENLQEILEAFRTWEFTLYPEISIGFDSHREVLIINPWSWMFSVLSNADRSDVGFAPFFLKAAELVHEFQHYDYLKKNKMLGVSEAESDLFAKEHGSEMEKMAFRRQIAVLQRYKEFAVPETFIITFRIDVWRNDGSCSIKPKEYRLKTEGLIDGFVRQYEAALNLVKEDTGASKYAEESDRSDAQTNEAISKALNLPIDVNLDKTHYQRFTFAFNCAQ